MMAGICYYSSTKNLTMYRRTTTIVRSHNGYVFIKLRSIMGDNSRFPSPQDLTMMETTHILEYHDDKKEVLHAGMDVPVFEIWL